jgi:hypothetical protein
MPTATGTAALSTPANGATTEIGPEPSVERPHAERLPDAVQAAPKDRTRANRSARGQRSKPSNTASTGYAASITRSAATRRAATPPTKSLTPYETADSCA